MSVSAGGGWEMLGGRRDSQLNYSRYRLFSTYSAVLWFYWEAIVLCPWGMQVPGEKAVTGLASRLVLGEAAMTGTVGPADLERTLVVIAVGLWQGRRRR